jgi:hypothetical protein
MRVFEAGHRFEALLIEWLRAAGFEIRDRNRAGEQFEASTAKGRIKGHIDGAVVAGPPIVGLTYPALLECKALKAKYWNAIVKKGLQKAEPKYYAQCQQYMGYLDLRITLFVALNKDTAEIYHEIVPIVLLDAQKYSDRGVSILKALDMRVPPARIAANRDFHLCRMCEFNEFCWSTAT